MHIRSRGGGSAGLAPVDAPANVDARVVVMTARPQ
jgi:hypothetical protein